MEKSTRGNCFLITAAGCGAFIVVTGIAMFFYPGGTENDPNTEGYLFTLNFFSDLGRTVALNGESNDVAHYLFTISAVAAGLGLIPYFLYITPYIYGNNEKVKNRVKQGRMLAIPVALGYVAIGGFPVNLYFNAHMISVGIAFLGSVLVLGLYISAIKKNPKFPINLTRGYYILFLIIFLYLVSSGLSLLASSDQARLKIAVIGQKICLYAEMLWGIFEGLYSARYVKKGKLS